jgi:hypothetical protein
VPNPRACEWPRGWGNHDFGDNIYRQTYDCGGSGLICGGVGVLDCFGAAARALRDFKWWGAKVRAHAHTWRFGAGFLGNESML